MQRKQLLIAKPHITDEKSQTVELNASCNVRWFGQQMATVTRTLPYAADIAAYRNGQQMSAKALHHRWKDEIQIAFLRRAATTRALLRTHQQMKNVLSTASKTQLSVIGSEYPLGVRFLFFENTKQVSISCQLLLHPCHRLPTSIKNTRFARMTAACGRRMPR